jgi:hypothetical protein
MPNPNPVFACRVRVSRVKLPALVKTHCFDPLKCLIFLNLVLKIIKKEQKGQKKGGGGGIWAFGGGPATPLGHGGGSATPRPAVWGGG